MTQVTIDGITYKSKIEAVKTLYPNVYLKSGTYITHVDPDAKKRNQENSKERMKKRYDEDIEYREKHKQQCRERYQKKKSNKITFSS